TVVIKVEAGKLGDDLEQIDLRANLDLGERRSEALGVKDAAFAPDLDRRTRAHLYCHLHTEGCPRPYLNRGIPVIVPESGQSRDAMARCPRAVNARREHTTERELQTRRDPEP